MELEVLGDWDPGREDSKWDLAVAWYPVQGVQSGKGERPGWAEQDGEEQRLRFKS